MSNNFDLLSTMFDLMLESGNNAEHYQHLSDEAYARLVHSYADDESLEDACLDMPQAA